jgi:hypothetical protein
MRRELEALGEVELDADEGALLAVGDGEVDSAPDVAAVARLHELAEPIEGGELSELAGAAVRRRIEERRPGRAGRRGLVGGLGLAAAAVAVAALVRWRSRSDQRARAAVLALRGEARAGLAALGVQPDGGSERARRIAAEYAARVRATEGAG